MHSAAEEVWLESAEEVLDLVSNCRNGGVTVGMGGAVPGVGAAAVGLGGAVPGVAGGGSNVPVIPAFATAPVDPLNMGTAATNLNAGVNPVAASLTDPALIQLQVLLQEQQQGGTNGAPGGQQQQV